MTALAQPTEAIATLKKIAKPIPFAANDQPVAELRNIQTLMKAERYAEARDRLDRLFVMHLIDDLDGDAVADLAVAIEDLADAENRLENALEESATLRLQVEGLENRVEELEGQIEALREGRA